ncbi:hypothetical protein [Paraburkholderia sp. DGU8]|uniref:hypothetical protein n=1 Tax=Paraburkholderia sp. DGU8 TaxID=3161997 RepID=UPI003464F71B
MNRLPVSDADDEIHHALGHVEKAKQELERRAFACEQLLAAEALSIKLGSSILRFGPQLKDDRTGVETVRIMAARLVKVPGGPTDGLHFKLDSRHVD